MTVCLLLCPIAATTSCPRRSSNGCRRRPYAANGRPDSQCLGDGYSSRPRHEANCHNGPRYTEPGVLRNYGRVETLYAARRVRRFCPLPLASPWIAQEVYTFCSRCAIVNASERVGI